MRLKPIAEDINLNHGLRYLEWARDRLVAYLEDDTAARESHLGYVMEGKEVNDSDLIELIKALDEIIGTIALGNNKSREMNLKEATSKSRNDLLASSVAKMETAKKILLRYIQTKMDADEIVAKEFPINEGELLDDEIYNIIAAMDDIILSIIKTDSGKNIFTNNEIGRETIYRKK